MIYTITTNPSIDYVLRIPRFVHGGTLRAETEEKYPGGKGIMVSKLLQQLGEPNMNLGFVGGKIGDFIVDAVHQLGLEERFTRIQEESRINVKLKYGEETEINAPGPEIRPEEVKAFFRGLEAVREEDILILSGSLPRSLGDDFYRQILEKTRAKFTLDLADERLLNYLPYRPLLVKPNREELGAIFSTTIAEEELFPYARKLLELGARHVIVSLGAEGSIFVDPEHSYRALPIAGQVVNSVGAGDSMVAAFVYALSHGQSSKEAYRLAVAAGTATAFSPDIAEGRFIRKLQEKVEVIEGGNEGFIEKRSHDSGFAGGRQALCHR